MFKKKKFEEIQLECVKNIQPDNILLGIILIIILILVLLLLVVFAIYHVKNCKCKQTLLKIDKENKEFIQILNNHHQMSIRNIENERQIQNSKIVHLIKKLNNV